MSYKLNKPYNEKQRIDFVVQYNHVQNLEIFETDNAIYALEKWETLNGDTVVDNTEEYNQKIVEEEKARIQGLSMTRSDFFDGTIMAWGVGQDELLTIIQDLLSVLPLENTQKLIAINNYKNALNFYRKHDLFKILIGIDIPLSDTLQLTITDESLDKFFDEVSKGNKATAWQYLPQPTLIPTEEEILVEDSIEVEQEESEDTTNN